MKYLLSVLLVILGSGMGQLFALECIVVVRYNRNAEFGWGKELVFTGEKAGRIIAFSQAHDDRMAGAAVPSAVVVVYNKEKGEESWLLDRGYTFYSDRVVRSERTKSSSSELLKFLSQFKEYRRLEERQHLDVNDPSEPDPFEKK